LKLGNVSDTVEGGKEIRRRRQPILGRGLLPCLYRTLLLRAAVVPGGILGMRGGEHKAPSHGQKKNPHFILS
jgi:hypothetical protein